MTVGTGPDASPGAFSVACVGASAGGIQALQELFAALPPTPDLAVVVVQHRLPHEPSRLSALLGRWTALPVRDAAVGLSVEPGTLYVAPPEALLMLESGRFVTCPFDRASARPGNFTIDAFLESLAADAGPRAIAVILTGTGSDGAAGAVRVKQAGGRVLVQDPVQAAHDGMPRAVMATGAVDQVLPLAGLARVLAASTPSAGPTPASRDAWEAAAPALAEITQVLAARSGLDLGAYKTAPLIWRIQQRMDQRRVPTWRDYAMLLRDDPVEVEALMRALPIHVTRFFRDPSVWDALQQEVIPALFAEGGPGPVRAWTPACATGQEAYSVSMLLAEYAATLEAPRDFQVFATDAAAAIVARASAGMFDVASVKDMAPTRAERWFYMADGGLRVKRELREKMVFAPHDLLADPPFTGLDLVTCRNLLIYLDARAGRRVLALLHSALRMGGYLVLGLSEGLPPGLPGFTQTASGSHIFRKTAPADVDPDYPRRPPRLSPETASRTVIDAVTHTFAVEESGVPSVLLDENLHILRVFGDAARFVRLGPGAPTLDASLLVPDGWELAKVARRALHEGAAVTASGLRDPLTGERSITLRVTPVPATTGGARLLVSFVRDRGARDGEPMDAADRADWTEALRLSHEELSASREELQALNEELRSSNDQLNIANEQLRVKLAELQTQSDVLSSGAVMTLFLDEALRVRWYTPAVTQLFPLRPHDAGRAITDLVAHFDRPHFTTDIAAVMRSGETSEAEVRTRNGRWYRYRIRPFRTPQDTSVAGAGVAITFDEVTAIKLLEERQSLLLRLSDAMRPLRDSADIQRTAFRMLGEHLHVDRVFGYTMARAPDGFAELVDDDGFNPGGLPSVVGCHPVEDRGRWFGDAMERGETVFVQDVRKDLRIPWARASGDAGVLALAVCPILRAGQYVGGVALHHGAPRTWTEGEATLIRVVAERIWAAVELARVERASRDSEERHRMLFETMGQGYCEFELVRDASGRAVDQRYLEFNPAFERIFGIPVARARGRTASAAFPELEPMWTEAFERVAETGTPARIEHEVRSVGRWFEVHAYPRGGDRLTALFEDITDRKQAELALHARESLQRYLLGLTDGLRALGDAGAILQLATRMLRAQLGVGTVMYAETTDDADGAHAARCEDRDPRMVPVAGVTHRFSGDNGEQRAAFARGEVRAFEDVDQSAETEAQKAAYRASATRASIIQPLVREGRVVAMLVACDSEPHAWTARERELIRETAERTWVAVERARAGHALARAPEELAGRQA